MKICSLEDCEEKHRAKGMCYKHYNIDLNKRNPNIAKRASKKYHLNHKEKRNKQCRKYHKTHREEISIRKKKYNKEYPEARQRANKKQLEKLGEIFDMTSNVYLYAIQSWSDTIKKLDNYMCKNCGSKEKLNAHHIMPKAQFPELSLDLDNGVTLCEDCHGETHGFELY